MSLIRMGALGSKRGIGIDPATLSPTGHWIGGVGITLNTTPDPDTISAWADQSGNGHNMTATIEPEQPFARIYSGALLAPAYDSTQVRLLRQVPANLITAAAQTVVVCLRLVGVPAAKHATVSLNNYVAGEIGGYYGMVAYGVGGAPKMSTYTFVSTAARPTPGDVDAVADENMVAIMRLSGGVLLARSVWGDGSSGDSKTVGSVPDPDLRTIWGIGHRGFESARTNMRVFHAATWNTALTDDQITDVAAFLLHRYASAT